MKSALTSAAIGEAAMGLALLIVPSFVGQLLLARRETLRDRAACGSQEPSRPRHRAADNLHRTAVKLTLGAEKQGPLLRRYRLRESVVFPQSRQRFDLRPAAENVFVRCTNETQRRSPPRASKEQNPTADSGHWIPCFWRGGGRTFLCAAASNSPDCRRTAGKQRPQSD
jgi:hypothetical protein